MSSLTKQLPQLHTEKHDTLQDAYLKAKELTENSDKTIFIIESGGAYYTDESSFTRTWERSICQYAKGKQVS